jgi:HEAT repeat protein
MPDMEGRMIDDAEPVEDRELFAALAAMPWPEPPASLAHDFRARARRMAHPPHRWRFPLMLGLAAALLLMVSFGWLQEHRSRLREGAALQRQFAGAMQSVSAGARLTAIAAAVREHPGADDVERALVAALLTDQSASVRVAAAEALGRIGKPATLAPTLRHALALETSPFVQVAMLHATDRLSVADRRGAVQQFLNRTDLDESVRSEAISRIAGTTDGDSR